MAEKSEQLESLLITASFVFPPTQLGDAGFKWKIRNARHVRTLS